MKPDSSNYLDIFLNDSPLLDVRAPVEFVKGAFPTSTNIPLLDDDQRAEVGTEYKKNGQDAAIELGWRLASPEVKSQRQRDWLKYIEQNPQGYLHCARGGKRSQLSQQLIREAGGDYPLVEGGFKKLRNFLLAELEKRSVTLPLMLISGSTCSGKTILVKKLSQALDLEGMANHRGSVFGRTLVPQPTQISFENALSIAVLKHTEKNIKLKAETPLFVEDEGRLIGRVAIPDCFRLRMQSSNLIVVLCALEERVEIAFKDYVEDAYPQYLKAYGEEEGFKQFREQLLGSISRIKKRLGSERYYVISQLFDEALSQFGSLISADKFRSAIRLLLEEYYDPMYDYQRKQRAGRVVFEGDQSSVMEWISENALENSNNNYIH
ncbi:tRNA 2-selenouridine(34) synthase MnmH [Aurantivibrio infirmus]